MNDINEGTANYFGKAVVNSVYPEWDEFEKIIGMYLASDLDGKFKLPKDSNLDGMPRYLLPVKSATFVEDADQPATAPQFGRGHWFVRPGGWACPLVADSFGFRRAASDRCRARPCALSQ